MDRKKIEKCFSLYEEKTRLMISDIGRTVFLNPSPGKLTGKRYQMKSALSLVI